MIYLNLYKFSPEELEPALSFIMRLFTDLFIKHKDDNEFEYTFTEYITQEDFGKAMMEDFSEGRIDVHPDYWCQTAFEILEGSGFIRITFDDNHFPPQINMGASPELINMIKFCLGVFASQDKKGITLDDVELLLQQNLSQFESWSEDMLEDPRIKKVVIKNVHEAVCYYLEAAK